MSARNALRLTLLIGLIAGSMSCGSTDPGSTLAGAVYDIRVDSSFVSCSGSPVAPEGEVFFNNTHGGTIQTANTRFRAPFGCDAPVVVRSSKATVDIRSIKVGDHVVVWLCENSGFLLSDPVIICVTRLEVDR